MVLAALAVVAALLAPADAAALPSGAQEPATPPDLTALDGGSLWRSSSNTLSQTTSTGNFKAVSAGWHHSCGLRTDATITCWGGNSDGQVDAPGGAFSAVSAGGFQAGSHSCGLRTDATITCWGDNEFGQVDAPSGAFSAVSAGGDHSCALRTDGAVICWGASSEDWHVVDAPSGAFSAVSAGGYHSCALRTRGVVVCWGTRRTRPVGPSVLFRLA